MKINFQYRSNIETKQVLTQFKNLLFPDLNKKNPARIPKYCDITLALSQNKVVALLVVKKDLKSSIGEAISLFVAPSVRRKGIGTNLVKAFEKGMQKQNLSKLHFYFRAHWPSSSILTKILQSRKWTPPQLAFVIVDGLAKNVLQLFNEKQEFYPPGYASIPWSDLSVNHKEEIKALFIRENIAQNQNPFIASESINQTCSLILFKDGMAVGWVVSHVISESTNEFTSFYISTSQRSHNLAYCLMRDTIFRQHELTNQEKFIIVSQANNSVMSSFLLRHAQKTKVKLVKTMVSKKLIQNP